MTLEFFPDSHLYFRDGKYLPSVSRILVDLGFVDTTFFTEEGRNRGSAVHIMVKHHAMGGGCMEMTDELTPYFEAYKKFENEMNWRPEVVETPMANESFAGTPDAIGLMNDCPAVVDWKTGVTLSPANPIQLAFYEILWGKPLKRFILQLLPTGNYRLTEYNNRGDRYIALAASAIWWWKFNNLKNKKDFT